VAYDVEQNSLWAHIKCFPFSKQRTTERGEGRKESHHIFCPPKIYSCLVDTPMSHMHPTTSVCLQARDMVIVTA
jgi:hypothetical protein